MKQLDIVLKNKRKILFFDLEATQESKEVIAIGAIKVNLDAKNFIKSKDKTGFKKYVLSNGPIGKYVENLTHINQDYLNKNGIKYTEMLDKLEKYIGKNIDDFLFVSYGNFDIKLLYFELEKTNNYKIDFIKKISKNYLDFSEFVSKFIKDNNGNKCSLIEAIVNLNGTPYKNEHDPLIDTKNLILLFDLFSKNKSIIAFEYKKVLSNYGKYPRPIANIIKKLNANQNVTPTDFEQYINDELN